MYELNNLFVTEPHSSLSAGHPFMGVSISPGPNGTCHLLVALNRLFLLCPSPYQAEIPPDHF